MKSTGKDLVSCCNPSNMQWHKWVPYNKLRPVPDWAFKLKEELKGKKICDLCRKLLYTKLPKRQSPRKAGTRSVKSDGHAEVSSEVQSTEFTQDFRSLQEHDTSQDDSNEDRQVQPDNDASRDVDKQDKKNVEPVAGPSSSIDFLPDASKDGAHAAIITRSKRSLEYSTPNISSRQVKSTPPATKSRRIEFKERVSKIKIQNEYEDSTNSSENSSSLGESSQDPIFNTKSEATNIIQKLVSVVGQSPIDAKKFKKNKKYRKSQFKKVTNVLHDTMGPSISPAPKIDDDFSDLMQHLVTVYKNFPNNSSARLQLLSLMPPAWSARKIEKLFDCSIRKVLNAKKNKPLEIPRPKIGRRLPDTTLNLVNNFYLRDNVSRPFPGSKDYVTVKNKEGEKQQIQKRLLLANLDELYQNFKEENINIKIGFSTFATLRPKQCLLAGAPGTHSVCVCSIHQNPKLMFYGAQLNKIMLGECHLFDNYKSILKFLTCEESHELCYTRHCNDCKNKNEELKNIIQNYFEENDQDNVSYKQWVKGIKNWNLETITSPIEKFSQDLLSSYDTLVLHHHVSTKQSEFVQYCKNNLKEGEVFAICDFSENFEFVIQDSIQSYYWTREYVTIHSFAAYYMENEELKHEICVQISEILEHNTAAVYLYQTKFVEHLKIKFGNRLKKIIYFSDGAASQYKNRKNFLNLAYHEKDFNVSAHWHCSGTGHGKGPCDAAAGLIKRLARRASLQRPLENQINTPKKLYDFCCDTFKTMHFDFFVNSQYEETESFLSNRFLDSKLIPDTRSYHSFIPHTDTNIRVSRTSDSRLFKTFSVSKSNVLK